MRYVKGKATLRGEKPQAVARPPGPAAALAPELFKTMRGFSMMRGGPRATAGQGRAINELWGINRMVYDDGVAGAGEE